MAICAAAALQAQNAVTVPFVGCKSDGMAGPADAPTGKPKAVGLSEDAAEALAYYKAEMGLGVLAPRGWHCFGTYGSSGTTLYVAPGLVVAGMRPAPLDDAGVQISWRDGDTSGRFAVTEAIARVFPAFRKFADEVEKEGIGQAFPSGPYPADKLTYKGDRMVEFRTAAGAEGLGTESMLRKSRLPIDGAAMLVGDPPNLVVVYVRLLADRGGLVRAIVEQAEKDAK
jgi:hypothetical protein